MSELVCQHGSFRRKCELCERDDRIAELERELIGLEQRITELERKLEEATAVVKAVAIVSDYAHRFRLDALDDELCTAINRSVEAFDHYETARYDAASVARGEK